MKRGNAHKSDPATVGKEGCKKVTDKEVQDDVSISMDLSKHTDLYVGAKGFRLWNFG